MGKRWQQGDVGYIRMDGLPVQIMSLMGLVSLAIFAAIWDGTRVRSWRDPWWGKMTMSRQFPELFDLAINQQAKVADYVLFGNDRFGLESHLQKKFPDSELEVEQLCVFQDEIGPSKCGTGFSFIKKIRNKNKKVWDRFVAFEASEKWYIFG